MADAWSPLNAEAVTLVGESNKNSAVSYLASLSTCVARGTRRLGVTRSSTCFHCCRHRPARSYKSGYGACRLVDASAFIHGGPVHVAASAARLGPPPPATHAPGATQLTASRRRPTPRKNRGSHDGRRVADLMEHGGVDAITPALSVDRATRGRAARPCRREHARETTADGHDRPRDTGPPGRLGVAAALPRPRRR